MDISRLLARCPDVVTLIVGPGQAKITCHTTLLGFKSEYFDAACFGGFQPSESGEIRMLEECPEAVSVFVSWLYTGRIPSCSTPPLALWILGDALRSPEFTNEAMHALFVECEQDVIKAETAEYIYANTSRGSKLRTFVKDLVLQESPLGYGQDSGDENRQSSAYENAWKELIRQGGDLVVDVAMEGSFLYNSIAAPEPCRSANHSKYMEPITTRPIEDFLEGKPREGTRKI
ncbi:hypothetical protein LSUB1_G006513 [Lachnellula subtilissima]|uniref:BTB domain-containing protein n=1 Tax=Lachnellula subtilissima TaxID=602034 RepID=A0A8H8RGR5_9HELO|nr:hypothetical protein LSUB1_G006513 [Lachnellula subtilissima]